MTDSKIILTGFQEVSPSEARRVVSAEAALPVGTDRKPLFIDPSRIRMLPPELQDYNCAACDRRSAGWAYLPSDRGPDPDPIPVCSLCWFYVLPWGTSRSDELSDFLTHFEETQVSRFSRDGDGRLVNHKEADRALLQLLRSSLLALNAMKLTAQK